MIRLVAIMLYLLANPLSVQCRQALVLGLDVSGSIENWEYRLQPNGLAAALRCPEVVRLILSNPPPTCACQLLSGVNRVISVYC